MNVIRTVRQLVDRLSYRVYSGTDRQRQLYEKVRENALAISSWKRRRVYRSLNEPDLVIPKDGFCTVPGRSFSQLDEMIERARKYGQEADLARIGGISSKRHLLYPELPPHELVPTSPFLRFALDPALLATISRYLGGIPVLYRVSLMHSRHVSGAGYESSQLYHCDWDAVSQIKVFVHVNEIGEQAGPLIVVDAEESGKLRKQLGYVYRSRKPGRAKQTGPRLTDLEVEGNVDRRFIQPILGPSGTVALVDTSRCLHMGSRVQPGLPPRLVVLFWYLKPSAFRFTLWSSRGFPYRHIKGELSELQELVVGRR